MDDSLVNYFSISGWMCVTRGCVASRRVESKRFVIEKLIYK